MASATATSSARVLPPASHRSPEERTVVPQISQHAGPQNKAAFCHPSRFAGPASFAPALSYTSSFRIEISDSLK